MQQEWLHSKLVEKKTQTLHTCWNDRKKKNRLVNKEIGHSMYIFTFFLFNMLICFWREVTCDYVWASLSVSVWALFYFVFTMLLTKIFLKVWIGPSKPQYSYICLKSQAFVFTITSAQGVVLRAQVCSLCASHTGTVQHAIPYECCRLAEPCRAAPSQLPLGWAAKRWALRSEPAVEPHSCN